jgi:hypothetical protein
MKHAEVVNKCVYKEQRTIIFNTKKKIQKRVTDMNECERRRTDKLAQDYIYII